jgi:hypothetical protein
VKNFIEKIRIKILNLIDVLFLNSKISKTDIRIKALEETVSFLSNVVAEQTRLVASMALIQSDIARSIDMGTIGGENSDAVYVKIPVKGDDFIN